MKDIFSNKVMLGFIMFVLLVGYINTEQIKMDNAKYTSTETLVINA